MRFHVVRPEMLASVRVEAVDETREIANKKQSFRSDGDRRNTAIDFLEAPNLLGRRHVAGASRIDAHQVSETFAMFRILADSDINAVLPKGRRRINFARAFFARVTHIHAFGRIRIEPPYALEDICFLSLDLSFCWRR